MDILTSLVALIGILLIVVIYQSRKEKPNIKLYLNRLRKLIFNIVNYFRDIGIYSAQRFKEIDWDLKI